MVSIDFQGKKLEIRESSELWNLISDLNCSTAGL